MVCASILMGGHPKTASKDDVGRLEIVILLRGTAWFGYDIAL
jgi:hypothetical protein